MCAVSADSGRVRLPETRWGLGKLGGVIVVVAGTAGLLYVLFFSGPGSDSDPNQGAIRKYYESHIGGSVPSDVANRLHVEQCAYTPLEEDGHTSVVQCDVSVGKQAYRPCFGFDVDRVVSGPYQINRSDCDHLVYDPARHDFVLSRN